MGKSNRIRNERATKISAAPVVKKKKGMPNWAINLITLVVTIAVLLSVVLGLLSSNGVFLRMSTPMRTDNYKVTGNMLSYYFNSNFQSFYSSYSSLLGGSTISLDLSKDLKDQEFGTSLYDTAYLGSFTGTWFDYFMNQTTTQVTEMLVYCEEADARGIALDDEDMASIDAEISALQTYATLSGYPSVSSYIAAAFGEGISVGDIRDCLELSTLASKCATTITEEYDNGLPFDSEEIVNKYNDNKKDFDVIDYTYYVFSTSYDDAVEAILGSDATDEEIEEQKYAIEAKYKELVDEVAAKAETLKAITTQADFKNFIMTEYIKENYDELYATSTIEADTVPPVVVREAIKAAIIAEVTDMAINDKSYEVEEETTDSEDETATTTIYEQVVNVKFAKAMKHLRESLLSDAKGAAKTYTKENIFFSETEFLKWAFGTELKDGETAPKALDIKTVVSGEKVPEKIDDESSYSESVYMLLATPAPNKDLTRDLTFATFTSKEDATKFIELLKGKGETLSAEDFETYAKENKAAATDMLENYSKGEMGLAEFDNWAYSDKLVKNGYSTSPITVSADSSYVVIHYTDDGEETWKVTVKTTLLNEKLEANYEEMLAKYAPVEKPNAIARINGFFGG